MSARALVPTVAIWLAASWLTAPAAGQELRGAKTHRDWTSLVAFDGHEMRFRAVTAYTELMGVAYLNVDRLPGECERQYLSLTVLIPRAANASASWEDNLGALRVDRRPVRAVRYAVNTEEGLPLVLISIVEVRPDAGLIDELRRGDMLRLKMGVDGRSYFLRFSLKGLAAASDRTRSLCRGTEPDPGTGIGTGPGGGPSPDAEFFDDAPAGKTGPPG